MGSFGNKTLVPTRSNGRVGVKAFLTTAAGLGCGLIVLFALAGPAFADDTVLEAQCTERPDRIKPNAFDTEAEQRLKAIVPPLVRVSDADTKGMAAEAIRGRKTLAITGDTIFFLGRKVRLADVTCPPLDVVEGLRAKGLMNTFLRRAGYFYCEVVEGVGDMPRAVCTVAERKGLAGRSIAVGMVQSGLCTAGDAAKGEGT